tara:strand:+ start:1926 stop:2927 length:1002 start_codon:yes stop_codon:yes gene_type:complete
MLRTKNLITDIQQVPDVWIFEYYLGLAEKLTGQDVKMLSIFNKSDKDPSFFIYYSNTSNKYKFKDFSANKHGDSIELVKELFNYERRFDAVMKVTKDYNDFVMNNGHYSIDEFKIRAKYQVKSFVLRNWTKVDEKYWMKYKINSKLLDQYNVQPLSSYTLEREDLKDKIEIKGITIYGYFRKDGSLYKLYQPLNLKKKFLKVKDYIQGVDQLTFEVPYLIICSSLKDGLAFKKLGFKNAEFIAPHSENSVLPERVIKKFKDAYTNVCTLFDNDEPGINAMLKYKELYNIPGAHLKVEKDLADCVATHGIKNTREFLYPVLTKALTGTIKQLPE